MEVKKWLNKTTVVLALVFIVGGVAIGSYLANKDKEAVAVLAQGEGIASDASGFKPKVGQQALPFSLHDLNEDLVEVGGSTEKLVFVNFWASWCWPCEEEMPDLQKLYELHNDKMTVIGVNVTSRDREGQARDFVADYELTFPILFDRKGDVIKAYKVNELPSSFLLNKEGEIVERITGPITYDEAVALIDKYSN